MVGQTHHKTAAFSTSDASSLVALAAGSAFFLFGYDTGVVATAMPWAVQSLGLSFQEYEIAVAVTTLMAGLAALGARITNVCLGRRGTALLAAISFFVGALIVACVPSSKVHSSYSQGNTSQPQSLAFLLLGRILLGAGCGFATVVVPVYIAEVVPPDVRGTLLSMEIFFTVAGQATAGVFNAILASCNAKLWRLSMGIAALPALFVFIVFYLLPETPRWLIQQGDFEAASRVLAKLRNSTTDSAEVRAELEVLCKAISQDREIPLLELWKGSPQLRRAMCVGIMLMMLQQLAAINTIMYYATVVIRGMGIGETTAAWLTCLCAVTQGLGIMATVHWRLPDEVGRRATLLGSTITVAACLTIFGVTYSVAPYFSLVALFAYLFSFGLGLSPMPWAINSEIYPMRARSGAMGQATFAHWETNFVVSVSFISLINSCGVPATFLGYAIITLIGAMLVYMYVPETAGQALEDIFADFKGPGPVASASPLHDRMINADNETKNAETTGSTANNHVSMDTRHSSHPTESHPSAYRAPSGLV